MLDSSAEYKKMIHQSGRVMSIHDTYTFSNGSKPTMKTENFMTYSINEATSDSSSFSIGAAVIKKYSACLNNTDGKFDTFDFEGLNIIARVGLQLEDGSLEIIPKGTYRCVNAKFAENTIDIEAYDSMLFFDRPYSESTLKYPATIEEIIKDACLRCQMTFDVKTIRNGEYIVKTRPDDSNMTFRDIIGYCAQLMCCYARIDKLDQLSFGWYDFQTLEELQNGYDGGNFTNYSGGDRLDGGNFTDYSGGDNAENGNFEKMKKYHHMYSLGSQNINTDDICVTGINVQCSGESAENQETEAFLYGTEGYVLSIEENPLIQEGYSKKVATYIGEVMVGKRFRPLSISCQSDPCIEAGDCACVTDRKQRTFFTVITNTTFSFGAMQTVESTAETPTEKNFTKYGSVTKILQKAKNEMKTQIGTYDLAVQQLTNLMAQSFGVFKSEEVLADGSIIYYMHNKPDRENSSTIWKMTANAFAVSTDGGKTWNAGMDSSGNAVATILNAIGVNADWINAGNILIGGAQNNTDGAVGVYDKSGKLLFKVSKNGIIINTDNLKVTENGNIELTGKLTGMDKVYIRNAMQNIDRPVIQYKWTTENAAYEFLDPDGFVIMKTSQQGAPVYFPQETSFKQIEIQSLSGYSIGFKTDGGVHVIDPETDLDMTNILSGTARVYGAFVSISGKLELKMIDAGENCSFDVTKETLYGTALPAAVLPKHRGVDTAVSVGNRVMCINLNTSGILSVKNCGTDYKNSKGTNAYFRFDYILM